MKALAKKALGLLGYGIFRQRTGAYNHHGLYTVHNHDFMDDPDFIAAYQRGIAASDGVDNNLHWRTHIGLWAASVAALGVPGDFVERGVNKGHLGSAIMEYLDWNELDGLDRRFFFLDTFYGRDMRYVSAEDRRCGAMKKNAAALAAGGFNRDPESLRRNFREWDRVKVIEGPVPETLDQVDAQAVAFLHLDMNCSPPTVAAIHYFWDMVSFGGIILFDDYCYCGEESEHEAIKEACAVYGRKVLSLPTGQGLLIR